MDTTQILNTSDDAAKFVTDIEGWVDRHGRFFGNDKNGARWSGCTHIVCSECGQPTPKNYLICESCREKKAIKRYESKERKKWGRETPLYSETADEYFFDEDSLRDFLEDDEYTIQSLRLTICDPVYFKEVYEDYFCDELSEDGELPQDIIGALEDLNTLLRNHGPASWTPGKYAADITLNP